MKPVKKEYSINYNYSPFYGEKDIKTFDSSYSPDDFYAAQMSLAHSPNPFDIYLQKADQSMLPLYEQDFSEEYENDLEYMKHMYPKTAKTTLAYVEDECDRLEYDGSCMFDDYPDKIQLGRIVNRIYEKMRAFDDTFSMVKAEDISTVRCCQSSGSCRSGRCYPDYSDGKPDWLRTMIEIMLYNEILNRRRRYRNRKRWF